MLHVNCNRSSTFSNQETPLTLICRSHPCSKPENLFTQVGRTSGIGLQWLKHPNQSMHLHDNVGIHRTGAPTFPADQRGICRSLLLPPPFCQVNFSAFESELPFVSAYGRCSVPLMGSWEALTMVQLRCPKSKAETPRIKIERHPIRHQRW